MSLLLHWIDKKLRRVVTAISRPKSRKNFFIIGGTNYEKAYYQYIADCVYACIFIVSILSAPKPDLFFTGRAFFYLLKCFIDLAADNLYMPYRL